VLEEQGMNVVSADNGRDAIRLLSEKTPVDIVLMDIMMPEMDGIDTMLEIRTLQHCKDLPIVAVTAKAMKGDRESPWKRERGTTCRNRLTRISCWRSCAPGCIVEPSGQCAGANSV
jgi:CheY-like chemotaxis protein